MKIYLQHPQFRDNPSSYLRQDYAAGVTDIKLKNTANFVADKFVVLGPLGYDQAELLAIDTVADEDDLTLATATKFPHNADQIVTLLDWNQIKVYRSTTGISGTYSYLETIGISIDQDLTEYTDENGSSIYYYKFAFHNSVSDTTGDLSNPYDGSGFEFYSLATLTNRVLSLFGDSNGEFMTRSEVKDAINEFYEHCQRELAIATKRHGIALHLINLLYNVSGYELPADFINELAVKLSTDGGSTFPYSIPMKQVDSLGRQDNRSNFKHAYTIFNGYIYLDEPVPTDTTHIIGLYYAPSFGLLISGDDTLAAPFSTATNMFVKYGLAICYLKDKKFDEYESLRDEAYALLASFISYIKRLNNMHPQFAERGR